MTQKVGDVLFIHEEEDGICEQCGRKDECRPYGKRLESGRRMRLCFECAMLDEDEAHRAFKELLDG
jgi:hypothetical protein